MYALTCLRYIPFHNTFSSLPPTVKTSLGTLKLKIDFTISDSQTCSYLENKIDNPVLSGKYLLIVFRMLFLTFRLFIRHNKKMF